MLHYIAFSWDNQIAERASLAQRLIGRINSILPHWHCSLATEHLHVYHAGENTRSLRAYLLARNNGVVLGKLFNRRSHTHPNDVDYALDNVDFNWHETIKIKNSKGRHLVDHYWGRYVMLLQEEKGVGVRILRDSTGAMPCMLMNVSGINVIFSHIEDCAAIGIVNNAINWDHVASYLWFPRLVTKDTGLDGVSMIQAGECLAISADRVASTYYWEPREIHDARILEDRRYAMNSVRDTIQDCVSAWASCYTNILHELSGGLDSAVVIACLSRGSTSANVICENFFTPEGEGDERLFAKEAAHHAGVELFETDLYASNQCLENIIDYTKVATPSGTKLVLEDMQPREALIKEHAIEAVFSGQGGDHFFQQRGTPLIAAEYAWRHGLTRGLMDVITDTSRISRQSLWTVMVTVVTSGLFHRHADPYRQRVESTPLFTEATQDALQLDNIRHPWVDAAGHLPASKIEQILDIVDSQNFYHSPYHHHVEQVHPLISQPVIELCLQIPCYVLTYGGVNRALMRDAFRECVPPDIIRRTTKGGTTNFINRVLVRNLPFIREFLLGGILMTEGVLDRNKADTAVTESALVRDPFLLFPMLNAIRAEIWLRTWASDDMRATA